MKCEKEGDNFKKCVSLKDGLVQVGEFFKYVCDKETYVRNCCPFFSLDNQTFNNHKNIFFSLPKIFSFIFNDLYGPEGLFNFSVIYTLDSGGVCGNI